MNSVEQVPGRPGPMVPGHEPEGVPPLPPGREKPQPGHEVNVPPPEPETERPGVGPEIGPGADIPGGVPEAPVPEPTPLGRVQV